MIPLSPTSWPITYKALPSEIKLKSLTVENDDKLNEKIKNKDLKFIYDKFDSHQQNVKKHSIVLENQIVDHQITCKKTAGVALCSLLALAAMWTLCLNLYTPENKGPIAGVATYVSAVIFFCLGLFAYPLYNKISDDKAIKKDLEYLTHLLDGLKNDIKVFDENISDKDLFISLCSKIKTYLYLGQNYSIYQPIMLPEELVSKIIEFDKKFTTKWQKIQTISPDEKLFVEKYTKLWTYIHKEFGKDISYISRDNKLLVSPYHNENEKIMTPSSTLTELVYI